MKPRILVILASCAALAGCSGVDGGPLVTPGLPTGTIEIVNQTGYALNAVNLSACGGFTHGLNRLGSGESIPYGGSMTFTVSAGCWDIGAGAIGVGSAFTQMQVAPNGISQYTVQ